jgi:hypothetical protein
MRAKESCDGLKGCKEEATMVVCCCFNCSTIVFLGRAMACSLWCFELMIFFRLSTCAVWGMSDKSLLSGFAGGEAGGEGDTDSSCWMGCEWNGCCNESVGHLLGMGCEDRYHNLNNASLINHTVSFEKIKRGYLQEMFSSLLPFSKFSLHLVNTKKSSWLSACCHFSKEKPKIPFQMVDSSDSLIHVSFCKFPIARVRTGSARVAGICFLISVCL